MQSLSSHQNFVMYCCSAKGTWYGSDDLALKRKLKNDGSRIKSLDFNFQLQKYKVFDKMWTCMQSFLFPFLFVFFFLTRTCMQRKLWWEEDGPKFGTIAKWICKACCRVKSWKAIPDEKIEGEPNKVGYTYTPYKWWL